MAVNAPVTAVVEVNSTSPLGLALLGVSAVGYIIGPILLALPELTL